MFLKHNTPSILWAVFILVLCLIHHSHLPTVRIPNFDKVVHFTFYFVLFSLTWYGWRKQNRFTVLQTVSPIYILLFCVAYGIWIEVLQETVTVDRHFDVLDIVANTVGASVGLLLFGWRRIR